MEAEINGFSCLLVMYGDHYPLARRCLGSILNALDPVLVPSIRIGMNAVCSRTRDFVLHAARTAPVEVLVYDSPVNRFKYPIARKMLFDHQHPVVTPYAMFFDDDSCLAPETTADWWSTVHQKMQQADVLGSLYRMRLRGKQEQAVKQQPWYTGKELHQTSMVKFATGGWWVARTKILQRWNWPTPDLKHRGGDLMFGELCRQQELRLIKFKEGVWVNADQAGHESKAKRRGFDEQPLWSVKPPGCDQSHNDFELHAIPLQRPRRPVPKLRVMP